MSVRSPRARPRWGWFVIVAALPLPIAALAWSAWRGPGWMREAGAACERCVAERADAPRGPGGCEEQEAFALGVLPWLADARQLEVDRCAALVRRRAIHHAARVFPNRERRDAWIARAPRPEGASARLWEYYEAGAYESLVAHVREIDDDELHRAALFAAMHLRSLDAVRAVVRHELPRSSVAGAGWRGPWLCLLGEEEHGRRLLRSWVEQAEGSPPDYYPLAYLAPLGPYACGGPAPRDLFPETEAFSHFLRLSRGELAPEELFDDFDLPTEVRRAALAHWLDDASEVDLALESVLAAVAGTSDVAPRRCTPYATPIDPGPPPIVVEVAERASQRLLDWLAAHDAELEALERALPPLWRRTSRYDALPEGPQTNPELRALIRAAAADLRFDAALALLARGDHDAGLRALDAARRIRPSECPAAYLLADRRPPPPLEPLDAESDFHARLARGDEAGAFAALAPRSASYQRALLGLTLGVPPPSVEHESWLDPETWWRGLATAGSLVELRQRIATESPYPSLRSLDRGALELAAAMELARRAADGTDEALFLRYRFGADVDRASFFARARAARRRGAFEEAREWTAWYRQIAGLASTPSRSLLLSMALEEKSVGMPYDLRADPARPPPPEEPPWRGFVRLDGEGLDLWSLVDGHWPAWDAAELALRTSTRAAREATARSRTYLIELPVEAITVDPRSGRATFEAAGAIPFELEPSSYSAGLPRRDWDAVEALVAEDATPAEVDAFWRERHATGRDTMFFVLTEPRVEEARGVTLLRARPYRFTSSGPVEDLRTTPYQEGVSHGIEVQVAFRVGEVRLHPRAGPLVECEVVATRVLGLDRVLAESR